MPDDERTPSPEEMRRLLYRRDVAVARHRASVARALGLTDVEMLALVHLAERERLAPSALASLLDLSSGGATALVQRLERAGHVTRHPNPTDRRSVLIGLAPATAARLEAAAAPLERGLAGLTEEQRATAADVLARLVALSEELEASLRREPERESEAPRRLVPGLGGGAGGAVFPHARARRRARRRRRRSALPRLTGLRLTQD